MTQDQLMDVLQQTVWVIVLLSAPVLITTMVVGLAISIFQAITQIQEATLTFVPKILISFLILLLTGPWMVDLLVNHTAGIFESLIEYAKPGLE